MTTEVPLSAMPIGGDAETKGEEGDYTPAGVTDGQIKVTVDPERFPELFRKTTSMHFTSTAVTRARGGKHTVFLSAISVYPDGTITEVEPVAREQILQLARALPSVKRAAAALLSNLGRRLGSDSGGDEPGASARPAPSPGPLGGSSKDGSPDPDSSTRPDGLLRRTISGAGGAGATSRQAGLLAMRDLRVIDPAFPSVHVPVLIVRRQAMLVNLFPVRCLILADRAILFVDNKTVRSSHRKRRAMDAKDAVAAAAQAEARRAAEAAALAQHEASLAVAQGVAVRVQAILEDVKSGLDEDEGDGGRGDGSDGGPGGGDEEAEVEEEHPFEFCVLEAVLLTVVADLERRTAIFRNETHRMIAELQQGLLSMNVNNMEQRLLAFRDQTVSGIRRSLTALLDNPLDLSSMYLTRQLNEPDFVALEDPMTHTESEQLLETYVADVETTLVYVNGFKQSLDHARETKQLQLQMSRVKLHRIEIFFTMLGMAAALGGMWAGLMGMNLSNGWETSPDAFWTTVWATVGGCGLVALVSVLYVRSLTLGD